MKVEVHLRSLLIQAMALLRNLAILSAQRDEFVSCGTIRGVVQVMSLWGDDQELLLNASRLLSKVSMTPSCQDEMAAIQPSVHATLLQVLQREQDKLPLVVRVVFVLGSLTSSDEDHRLKIFEHEGAIDLLLSLLETHVDALLTSLASSQLADSSAATTATTLTNHPSQDVLGAILNPQLSNNLPR
jgi:hypothetical protein